MQSPAVFFVAPRRVEIRPVEVREPTEGDILVRTLYSGISSGTEMLAYRGLVEPGLALDEGIGALQGSFTFPFQYGYSCVGVVEQSRSSLPVGSLVFAFGPHQGLFTQPGADAVALGESPPRRATLFPLVETALQISLDAGDVRGGVVVVFGLGPVGLLSAALLREAGADVVGVDPREWRRDAAAPFGVTAVAPDDVGREAAGAGGATLVVEATGKPEVLAQALGLLRHEGTALVASWYGSKPVALPLGGAFHRRRLTIRSSQVSTIPRRLQRDWSIERRRSVALDLLRGLPVDHLLTHEFDFHDAPAAFAAVDRGEPGLMHAALRYAAP